MDPSTNPKPAPRAYISELKIQLDQVNRRIEDLENKQTGAMDPRFATGDLAEARKLLARRKVLQDRIIFYDP